MGAQLPRDRGTNAFASAFLLPLAQAREDDEVKGKRVQVFLRTPLYRGKYDGANRLQTSVVEVVGTVAADTRVGLRIKVEALTDEQGNAEPEVPFKEIVLPPGKIDHLIVL